MSNYLVTVTAEIDHDWRAGIPFQHSEAARSALGSIHWMVGNLDNVPDVFMALGKALSKYKNGAEYNRDVMDDISGRLRKSTAGEAEAHPQDVGSNPTRSSTYAGIPS